MTNNVYMHAHINIQQIYADRVVGMTNDTIYEYNFKWTPHSTYTVIVNTYCLSYSLFRGRAIDSEGIERSV